ncbi:hypothetical protein [uncultured Flavobacterium sp.]|uniref:hypothetical protein n=1 Tax=uncultured Flavobacterium sp. TaxID=165435 RepID=UPI00259AA7BB|nr:hypothetical protein [uncultured Flavobacterium sp.]
MDKTFRFFLKENQLIFSMPKSYFALDSVHDYDPSPKYIQTLLYYSIKNKEDDIVIAFASYTIHEPKELLKKMFPKSKDINTLNPYLESEVDSTQSIPVKIEEKKLKQINADNGYVYNMKIIYPYLNKYNFCKKIIIHKDNVSNAEILFFYTKKDQGKIDKVIKDTWPLLRFKN